MAMTVTPLKLQQIIEAALMVAGRPLPIAHLQKLFDESEQPSSEEMQTAIAALQERHQHSGIELKEVSSGYQFQAKSELSPWLSLLWEERPARYSRAFLETLALIAYRQPITRAEIEEIRGVAVSTNIIKTLQEREWIRVIGYKEVVGKPALYGTTKTFLDHFNLKSLNELPTLAELKDLDSQEAKLQVQLELPNPDEVHDQEAIEEENTLAEMNVEAQLTHNDSEETDVILESEELIREESEEAIIEDTLADETPAISDEDIQPESNLNETLLEEEQELLEEKIAIHE